MPFYAIQSGSTLQIMQTDGTLESLTLPSGVTISSALRGRFAILGQRLFFVRAPSVNLEIDATDLTVRPMNLLPPLSPPILAAGSSTGLTGDYRARVSYAIKNDDGEILNESPLGPRSLTVTLANEDLSMTQIPVSTQAEVNCRRIYRTVAGGEVYFHDRDIDENDSTTFLTKLADAGLSLLPSDPSLGNPPGTTPGTGLSLISEWNNRLFGVSARYDERHQLLYTEDGLPYAWANRFTIPSEGEDDIGITGLIRRRDEFGICKRNRIVKLIGDSNQDFQLIVVAEGVGCLAPDSIVVIRDVAYFLSEDGVYTFGPDGVQPISKSRVDEWFTTSNTFNRSQFANAVGGYNPLTDCYELHLCAAGQTDLNRWVSYDIERGEWTGPHLTSKFTPISRALLYDAQDIEMPTLGATDLFLYKMNQTTRTDQGTAIAIDWLTKPFAGGAPDIMHFWDQPSIHQQIQETGGNLTLRVARGGLDAGFGSAISIPMTQDRVRLQRLGVGRFVQLNFTHSTDSEDVVLYGLELPFNEVGRR